MSEEKKMTFEQSLARLEEISNSLNSDNTTLEDAIKKYEEGIGYYKECNRILGEAKQKIEIFQKDLEA